MTSEIPSPRTFIGINPRTHRVASVLSNAMSDVQRTFGLVDVIEIAPADETASKAEIARLKVKADSLRAAGTPRVP